MTSPLVEKYLKKVPQYTRMSRHMWSVIKHGTPKKWHNLLRTEAERKLRRIDVKGRPYILFLDPCNYCNLRCPLCPTGLNDLNREQAMLSFEHFKQYFDPYAPYLFEVILHNWGESFINKEVYKMIAYAQSKNVGTNISSNFVIVNDEDIEAILDSGLEYLIISLDDADAETYLKYRVRGDFDRVVENMRKLIERRDARGQKTPVVEWQYIVMKHNAHQVDDAQRLADDIGVDLLRPIPVGLPFDARNRSELAEKWYPENVAGRTESTSEEQTYGQANKPSPCFYLYRSMTVNPDGKVSPCCVVNNSRYDFADLGKDGEIDLDAIWNNDKFRSGRALFSADDFPNRPRTVCDVCDIFEHHPSKVRRKPKAAARLASERAE